MNLAVQPLAVLDAGHRLLEQHRQRTRHRADDRADQCGGADLIEFGGERLVQLPGDLTLGDQLGMRGAPAHRGHGARHLGAQRTDPGVEIVDEVLTGVVARGAQRAQQDLHRAFPGAPAGDRRHRGAHPLVGLREEQLFLAGEIVEERACADVRRGGDVGHRGLLVASGLEQLGCGLEDGSAGTFAFAVTKGGWRHARTVRHLASNTSEARVSRAPFARRHWHIPCKPARDALFHGVGSPRGHARAAAPTRLVRVSIATSRDVDAEFLGLPLAALADAALAAATAAGAEHADLRVHRLVTQSIRLRDGRVEAVTDSTELGFAVRVIVDGTWGFASHAALTPDTAAEVARTAVTVATTLRALNRERVELAGEPRYADARWVSAYDLDPFTVPTGEKVALLQDYSERLSHADGVDHVTASVLQVKEQTFYADTAGSSITQQRVRLHPSLEAITVDTSAGVFETMRTLAPPVGRGWEYVTGADGVWDWNGELARIPEWLAEKVKAPSVQAGPTDLVIDPTNLWLTIHESIGHATEYDRAIGYESAYAGTSFATPDKLGTLRYGTPIMHVTGDRTEAHGLASVGYDDEGVAGQRWDLVRDGVLVGYQLDRVFAPRLGLQRSNGCSYADSAHHVPIQRMANVSLQPDPDRDTSTEELISRVDDGIYIVGDKSWSMDCRRIAA